jgi:hypothetical protein
MGLVKVILIFVLNITILVIVIRFVSAFLERAGVFRAMNRFWERIFGARNDDTGEKIYVDAEKTENIDEKTDDS